MSNNSIEYIKEGTFDAFKNLRVLKLINNNISLDNLFSFGNHSNLERLHLGNVEESKPVLVDSALQITNFYPNLWKLRFSNFGTEDIITENWNKVLPKLMDLNFLYSKGMKLENLFENFPPSIKYFWGFGIYLTHMKLAGLHNLSYIDLEYNDFRHLLLTDRLDTCKSKHQACVGPMKNLTRLNLSSCNISVLDIQFSTNDAMPNLRLLLLAFNKLKAIEMLPSINFYSLTEVNLDFSHLDHFNDSIQRFICPFRNLTDLSLSYMRGDFDAYLNKKFGSNCSTNLKHLYLNNNKLREIPKNLLENLDSLELLDLSKNRLKKFPITNAKRLKTLRLADNKIRCNTDCLDDINLEGLKRLKCLDLRGDEVGPDGLNYLKPVLNVTRKKMYPCYFNKQWL